MSWWLPHNFEAKTPYLKARMEIVRGIRAFFDEKGFWAVETPVLQTSPGMDTHIHAFKTGYFGPDLAPVRDFYLHTSPEFAMKKLMVAGVEKQYQLCPAFRNGESTARHSPEFTMLEWYRTGSGYRETMQDCVDLLRFAADRAGVKLYQQGDKNADPFLNWNFISALEAFDKYIKIDLTKYLNDTPGFAAVLQEKGMRTTPHDRWDDLFYGAMAQFVEPNLGFGAPTIFYDYPVVLGALARAKPEDPRFAERFEVYVCGLELANGFGELTDPAEQRRRFHEEMAGKKVIYGLEYPVDEDFLKAIDHGLPESSGVALGVDRLVMLATNAENIGQVLWAGRP